MQQHHHHVNYLELPARNLAQTKAFFSQVFAWHFTDYGPDYAAFSNSGVLGGFFQSDKTSNTDNGAALVVLYSSDLEQTLAAVETAGGKIKQAIFSFPGGRRFHFLEPSGNELAVWSDN
ncbi:VOC family protein [Pseudoalteromonas tunicata]|uniref:VOC family protein n=1 Tax=Pseudoalteromonas tunicata TaxID=314281 RepID=UPI00273F8FC3|nr:VOC family protein [Pseudoalteromonas tunicata]MDP4985336.1 VOC family protein [Pseudoalteromonas tunicata]